jgi:hypothetical protein
MAVLQDPGLCICRARYSGQGRDAKIKTDASSVGMRIDGSWNKKNKLTATLSTSPLLGMSFDSILFFPLGISRNGRLKFIDVVCDTVNLQHQYANHVQVECNA